MDLTPREKDKLLLFTAGMVAARRLARGLPLKYPEAVALIKDHDRDSDTKKGDEIRDLTEIDRSGYAHQDKKESECHGRNHPMQTD